MQHRSTTAYVANDVRPDSDRADVRRSARTEEELDLFRALARLPRNDRRRPSLCADLVRRYQGLAMTMARRYQHRGEPLEDLMQTANLGLVKAVNGFDVDRGTTFTTYATPMILGELRRYFRDSGWAVHVPRRVQNLKVMVHRAAAEFFQRYGEHPTPETLAEHLDLDEDEIAEGVRAGTVYSALSIEAFAEESADHPALSAVSEEDRQLDLLIDAQSVLPLLNELPERERTILLRRFYGNQTQTQIALALGVSQVHVSRLQNKACEWLRSKLNGP